MPFNVGDRTIVRLDLELRLGGQVVTIEEISSLCAGSISKYKLKEDPFECRYADNELLEVPYDQTNFQASWLDKDDVITLIDGDKFVFSGKLPFGLLNTLELTTEDNTDQDVYSVHRDGILLFQRKM